MTYDHKVRTSFIFLLFCSLYAIIVLNLYVIQIKQSDFYIDLGKKQYSITIDCMPTRAEIYDRTGQIRFALNQDNLSAFILPKEIKNKKQLLPFLKKYFPTAHERAHKNTSHFMYVKRRLSPEQISFIKESGIEDIHFLKEPARYYPMEAMTHIIGMTDIDNIGLFGIEKLFNDRLSGTASTFMLERDARSGHFYFTKETRVEGQSGQSVILTIDSDLQFLAHEELKNTVEKFQAKEAAALIINPVNGDIVVMAQYPGADPNRTDKIDLEKTKNKIILDMYEPGSVIKVFLALGAIEEGVVTPDELIDCENSKTGIVNGIKFSTVIPQGIVPFQDVIAHSNNIGVAKVAVRLGPKLYNHYKRVGFGTKIGIWPGESAGYVNPPEKWSRPSIVALSFGYEVTLSLLQLARALTILACDGYQVTPRLILDPLQKTQKSEKPLYTKKTIQAVRAILEKTVEKGSGQKAGIRGYTILGKTGTANLAINGKYSTEHNIYLFMGIVEKDDYKRIIITFVKDTPLKQVYASTIAAPLFEQIAEKVLIHDKII